RDRAGRIATGASVLARRLALLAGLAAGPAALAACGGSSSGGHGPEGGDAGPPDRTRPEGDEGPWTISHVTDAADEVALRITGDGTRLIVAADVGALRSFVATSGPPEVEVP